MDSKTVTQHAFSYWKGKPPTWLHLQTLFTFRKFNPDWEITLFTENCKLPKAVYYQLAAENITVTPVELDLDYRMSPMLRSDIFRWQRLHDYGGLWTDMDIIYFAPINEVIHDIESRGATAGLTLDGGTLGRFAIGLCAGVPHNEFYGDLLECCKIDSLAVGDQRFGTALISNVWDEVCTDEVANIAYSYIYRTHWTHAATDTVWYQRAPFHTLSLEFPAIGLHWYGSKTISRIRGEMLHHDNYQNADYECTVTDALKRAYRD